MIRNRQYSHFFHQRLSFPDCLRPVRSPKLKCRIHNIIQYGKIFQEAGLLENKSHSLQSQLLHFPAGQLRHIRPTKISFA